ncbi:MAG: hypothetical protein JNL01_02175 [Bdellovibrionales bacterium]|nr:hypothetical protein [Bdellovibrionales bacterium]
MKSAAGLLLIFATATAQAGPERSENLPALPCDFQLTKVQTEELVKQIPDGPVDPNVFARFGITTVKEYNHQVRLARSLIGKEVVGFYDGGGKTKTIRILGIQTKSYDWFVAGGISLLIDAGSYHTSASLRKVMLHANRIQKWDSPIPRPFPKFSMKRTVRPSQRPSGPEPVRPRVPFFEIPNDALVLGANPIGLTEISREDLIRLDVEGYRFRQLGILNKSPDSALDWAFDVAARLNAEIRVVRARSTDQGKEVDRFMYAVKDENGKRILLLSQGYLKPENHKDLPYLAFEMMFDHWVLGEIYKDISQQDGDDVAMDFHFSADWSQELGKQGKRTAPKTAEALLQSLSTEAQNKIKSLGQTMESLGELTPGQEDLVLYFFQSRFAKNGGRVEVVRRYEKDGTEIERSGATLVRGSRGEPVLLLTPHSVYRFAAISWVEFADLVRP